MVKIILYRIIAFTLINCLLSSQVLGKSKLPSIIDDLKNSYIEKNQLIEIKLVIGKTVIIKIIEKTNNSIKGYLVKFDQGTERTTNEEVKIYFDEIKDFKFIYGTTKKESKTIYFFIGLSIVFLIVFVKTLQKGGIII